LKEDINVIADFYGYASLMHSTSSDLASPMTLKLSVHIDGW